MADNYCQFSEVLPDLTKKQADWWERQLREIRVIGGKEYDDGFEVLDGEDEYRGYRLWRHVAEAEGIIDADLLGFEYSLDAESDEPDGRETLWLHASEHGDPFLAALAVQQFLKKFSPSQCWSLTYSGSCSRLRVGEFCGGGLFVTATKIKCLNGYDFVDRCRRKFDAAKKRRRRRSAAA